jgi:microcystin-dependent protein
VGQPFIGEIRMFAGTFAPAGWAFCNGQLLPIAEHDALFTLIGTTYGGDGQNTFALPDLQGRIPIHQGTGAGLSPRVLGQAGGTESVTLTQNQIPAHGHTLLGSTNVATLTDPGGNVLAQSGTFDAYQSDPSLNAPMAAQSISPLGGSQPHENMQPFVVVSFIIALVGIFPPPS